MNGISLLEPQIVKPTLLLDESRARHNIARMAKKADQSGVRFRPHFKTHQSAAIGQWFRDYDVTAITVSSVDMAHYFALHGWKDITVAFPVNIRQIESTDRLAAKIRLGLVLESTESAGFLGKHLNAEVSAWIKIDTGYGRTGIAWSDETGLTNVAQAITEAPRLRLEGILTHAGHTYGAGSAESILSIYRESVERMDFAQTTLTANGYPARISIGDTPGCSLVNSFEGVDEVRPGNFVFYDISQLQFGSCQERDIAVALACPVVAKHPNRQQIVLYGGAIHLSKESLSGADGRPIFGLIARPEDRGWSPVLENSWVVSLSQEHGIVQADERLLISVKVGDLLLVLPVHSCLTANLLGRYLTLEGNWIEMARF